MNHTLYVTMTSLGLPWSSNLHDGSLGGCAAVTPLPSSGSFVRVVYKFFFAIAEPSLANWNRLTAAILTTSTLQHSQIMCGSELNFQTKSPIGTSGTNTHPQVNQLTNSSWLLASAAGPGTPTPVCHTNVFSAPYP